MFNCGRGLWQLVMLCIGIGLVLGSFITSGRCLLCGLIIGGIGFYFLLNQN